MSQEPTDPTTGQEPTQDPPEGGEPATPTEGQEPKTFDAEYVKKLRDEAAAARTAKNSLEAKVKKYEDEKKTDLEKLEERAAQAEGKLTPLQAENARLSVAIEKGLVGDLAFLSDRLRGETKEELAADADELLKQFAPKQPANWDGGSRTAAPAGSMDDLIRGARPR